MLSACWRWRCVLWLRASFASEEKLHCIPPNLFYTFCIIIFLLKLCMRSHWEKMWPLAYLIGVVEQFFTSHCPWKREVGKKPWLFVNTGSFLCPLIVSTVYTVWSSLEALWQILQLETPPGGNKTPLRAKSSRQRRLPELHLNTRHRLQPTGGEGGEGDLLSCRCHCERNGGVGMVKLAGLAVCSTQRWDNITLCDITKGMKWSLSGTVCPF